MKRLVLCVLLIFLFSISLKSLVVGNHGEKAFNEGNANSKQGCSRIKTMIIMGGGHFLNSHSNFQTLLSKVELAELKGMNYGEMQEILSDVVSNIDCAHTFYNEFKNLAAVTPYDRAVIRRLKGFDYRNFRKKQPVNGVLFSKVENLLRKGRVTQLYRKMAVEMEKISILLHGIKKSLDNHQSPNIETLWKINQLYADCYLSGQYAAMIFRAASK